MTNDEKGKNLKKLKKKKSYTTRGEEKKSKPDNQY
jgi:hypothetical protein